MTKVFTHDTREQALLQGPKALEFVKTLHRLYCLLPGVLIQSNYIVSPEVLIENYYMYKQQEDYLRFDGDFDNDDDVDDEVGSNVLLPPSIIPTTTPTTAAADLLLSLINQVPATSPPLSPPSLSLTFLILMSLHHKQQPVHLLIQMQSHPQVQLWQQRLFLVTIMVQLFSLLCCWKELHHTHCCHRICWSRVIY